MMRNTNLKMLVIAFLHLAISVSFSGTQILYKMKTGKCVSLETAPQSSIQSSSVYQVVGADSQIVCAAKCINKPCMAWSFSSGFCNVSYTAKVRLVPQEGCSYWSKLEELNILAFWRLNNESRGYNFASSGDVLNALDRGQTEYSEDAVRITGSDGGFSFNFNHLTTMNLSSLAVIVWIKPSDNADFKFIYTSGNSSEAKTRISLYRTSTSIEFVTHYKLTSSIRVLESHSGVATNGAWNFIASHSDKHSASIYMNGAKLTDLLVDNQSEKTDQLDLGTHMYLGAHTIPGTSSFDGEMKCASITTEALSEERLAEIKALCN